jgi:hypothetical protein
VGAIFDGVREMSGKTGKNEHQAFASTSQNRYIVK